MTITTWQDFEKKAKKTPYWIKISNAMANAVVDNSSCMQMIDVIERKKHTNFASDEFACVKAFVDSSTMHRCDLCGEAHLKFVFVIKSKTNNKELIVGSRCVHNYIHVDLANAIVKSLDAKFERERLRLMIPDVYLPEGKEWLVNHVLDKNSSNSVTRNVYRTAETIVNCLERHGKFWCKSDEQKLRQATSGALYKKLMTQKRENFKWEIVRFERSGSWWFDSNDSYANDEALQILKNEYLTTKRVSQ